MRMAPVSGGREFDMTRPELSRRLGTRERKVTRDLWRDRGRALDAVRATPLDHSLLFLECRRRGSGDDSHRPVLRSRTIPAAKGAVRTRGTQAAQFVGVAARRRRHTDGSRQSRPTSTVAMINSIQASGLKGPPAKLLGAVDEGVLHGRLQVVEAVVAR